MAAPRADSYTAETGATVLCGRGSANKLTITGGSSSGVVGVIAPYFTVGYSGTLTGSVTVSMSDGAGGSFWPLNYAADRSVTISPASPTAVFFYCPVGAGAKSITTTNTGSLNNSNAKSFTATAYTAPSATPFRLTRGGSTIGSYATLQGCKDAPWVSGDVVKVTGGNYVVFGVDDPGNTSLTDNVGGIQTGTNKHTLTIEWETPGSPMVLDNSRAFAVQMWSGGQPRLLTMGTSTRNFTIRGLHFRGSRPPLGASWYGAATWTSITGTEDGATFTIEYCKFSELPDGIKSQDGRYDLSSYIRYCVFEDNSDGRGLDHDIYTGKGALTHIEGCTFRKTTANPYPQDGMGHFIKSRCRQTIIRGNLLDGLMSSIGIGGVAQSINTPNGGVVEVTGNTILHYGAMSVNSKGEPLRYGDDQHTATVDTSVDPSLTTHSVLFAQNTLRQALGRAPDGNAVDVVKIYPTGIATTLLNGSGSQVAVTATVRNNIASNDSTGGATFISRYPDNSLVSGSTISDLGFYSGAVVAGSPAVNDATLEWAGDFTIPVARTDTNRGSRVNVLPAWRSAMAAGTWATIPGNTLYDIDPARSATYNPNYPGGAPWAGTGGQVNVSRDWNSTVYDEGRDVLWIPLAGGHSDYAGNEPYKICLRDETPNWSMIRPPSGAVGNTITLNDGQEATGLYSDGRLRSVHSYTNNAYVDGLGPVITRTSAHFSSAAGRIQKVYAINEATGEASVLSDYTALAYPDPVGTTSDAGGCYDPSRGVIWHIGSGTARMLKTVVSTGVTTSVGDYGNYLGSDGALMIYIPGLDVIMSTNYTTPYFRIFDPVTSLWTAPSITGSQSAGMNASHMPGMDWCPALAKMLLWNNTSLTTEITTLTPGANPRTDAWTAGVLTVSGSNAVTPPAAPSSRTHKRFGYAPNLKGCYLFQSTTAPIYFFATE